MSDIPIPGLAELSITYYALGAAILVMALFMAGIAARRRRRRTGRDDG